MDIREKLAFTKLRIWQKAHELTLKIYKITAKFPAEEKYGLVSQLRRAAVSVELCIAEGHGRYYYAETVRFLLDAKGSIFEVQDGLLIAKDLKYPEHETYDQVIEDYLNLTKQINRYIAYKRKLKEKDE